MSAFPEAKISRLETLLSSEGEDRGLRSRFMRFLIRREIEKVGDTLVRIYDELAQIEDGWRASVLNDPETYDSAGDSRIKNLFRRMEGIVGDFLGQADLLEQRGHVFQRKERLKEIQREIEQFLTPHREFFDGDEFRSYAHQAWEEHKKGLSQPAEMFDE